jgi:hypothetical protein
LGLLAVSWLAHPAMVPRYALPAGVFALLVPLLVASRIDRRAPMLASLAFIVGSAPTWTDRDVNPGVREMAAFLQERVNPETEIVVLTLDKTIYPEWADVEGIVFAYYPLQGLTVRALRLGRDGVSDENLALKDPRGMWLIVLWADPFLILERAGRTSLSIALEGESFTQLMFPPYRLVYIAPLQPN